VLFDEHVLLSFFSVECYIAILPFSSFKIATAHELTKKPSHLVISNYMYFPVSFIRHLIEAVGVIWITLHEHVDALDSAVGFLKVRILFSASLPVPWRHLAVLIR